MAVVKNRPCNKREGGTWHTHSEGGRGGHESLPVDIRAAWEHWEDGQMLPEMSRRRHLTGPPVATDSLLCCGATSPVHPLFEFLLPLHCFQEQVIRAKHTSGLLLLLMLSKPQLNYSMSRSFRMSLAGCPG